MVTQRHRTSWSIRVQKLLLYLILGNFGLTCLYLSLGHRLDVAVDWLVTSLMLVYDLLLCRLVALRTRRQNDGYIVYPALVGNILFCVAVIVRYFIVM